MGLGRAPAWASLVLAAAALAAPSTGFADASWSGPISTNWSGYIASNAYYTGVSARIQTPVPRPDRTDAASACSWVGIGGADSSDLIQAGVVVDTSGSQITYTAWYETLPDDARPIALQIHPGDWIEVNIHEVQDNLWQIKMIDGGQVFQLLVPYTSRHNSAEWILEDPSSDHGLVPFASVSAANFDKMAAFANGSTSTPAQLSARGMALVGRDGQLTAVPSRLGDHGDTFVVAPFTDD